MTLFFNDLRARIECFIDPVSESHQAGRTVFILDLRKKRVNAPAAFDTAQHFHDLLIRSAVKRTGKRGDPCGDRRIQIHLCTADRTDRRRRTVLFVVGMKNQQNVQDPDRFRRNLVRIHRRIEHHVQKVGAVTQVVTRIDNRLADTLFICHRRHCADD